jgi:hypothetical protein
LLERPSHRPDDLVRFPRAPLLGTEDRTQTYGVVLRTLLLGLGVSPELAGPALETTLRLWDQGVSLVGGPPR